MLVELIPMLNEEGLDTNDYRGQFGVIDLPEEDAKSLIAENRASEVSSVAIKPKKKSKK